MIDPRDTIDPHDTTLMGPGFFVFFQRNIIESGGHKEKVFTDYGTKIERFRACTPDEKKVKPILEHVAEVVIDTPAIETKTDIELILRIRLELKDLSYKVMYLEWVLEQIERQKRNKAVILLLLH